jgi:hypothetical protein
MWAVVSGAETVRAFLLFISAAGALLFGSLLVLSLASPITIEHWARAAIEQEVEARVGDELHALSQTSLVRRAQALIKKHEQESVFDRTLAIAFHGEIERVVTRMQDPDCECRKRLLKLIEDGLDSNIKWLGSLDARLTMLIESKYAQVSQALIREVRIFSAANALVFLLLGLVAFVRKDAKRQLLAPTFVLLCSACVVGYLYLFQQDWLATVLLGDYVGMWYFGYLGIVMAFLADIVFNRGRVTATLIGSLGGVAGAAPC